MRTKTLFPYTLIYAVAAILCLPAVGVLAQKRPARQSKPQSCANAMTQTDMNLCASDEYKKADAEMNKVYQQAMLKLEPKHKEKLKTAQTAWIRFRDTHCECEAFFEKGGSIWPLYYLECLKQITKDRTI
jgi:uncharacterized protein YecT (DUF1311 family)